MKLVLPFLLVLGVAVHAQNLQCGQLLCRNGAICLPGDIDYADHPKNLDGTPIDQIAPVPYHCECSAGFTGIDCSTTVRTCSDGRLCL